MSCGSQTGRIAAYLCLLATVAAFAVSLPSGMMDFVSFRAVILTRATAPALVTILTCCGLGLLFLSGRQYASLTGAERLALAFGCGVPVLSLLVLGLGVLGWTNAAVVWSVAAAGIASGALRLIAIRRGGAERSALPEPNGDNAFDARLSGIAFRVLAGVAFVLLAVTAFAPPLLFDVTEYHLGAWMDYTANHPARFVPNDHNFYARFPFPIESLYYFGLLLDPEFDFAPKLINAAFVAFAVPLIMMLLKSWSVPSAWRWMAAALWLAHPVLRDVSIDAFIDAPVAFLVAGAVALALRQRSTDGSGVESRWFVLSTLWFGAALSAKYTVAQTYLLPFIGVFALPMGWALLKGSGTRASAALAMVLFVIPSVCWLGKNAVFYGNPLEPFFCSIFRPSDAAAIAREKFYIVSHFPQSPLAAGYWTSLLPRLREFAWIILAPAALAPLAIKEASLRRQTIQLLVFIGASYLLWNLVRESQNRFLLAAILLCIVLATKTISALPSCPVRGAVALLLATWCGFHVLHQTMKLSASGEFRYLGEFVLEDPYRGTRKSGDPLSPREEFYRSNLGALGELLPRIKELPPDARILLAFEARPYLISRQSVYNVVWNDSPLLRLAGDAASAAEVGKRLQEAGITHILVNREELRRYIQQYVRPEQLAALGLDPQRDHAKAFDVTSTPEDLYPSFSRDVHWAQARSAILEYLNLSRGNAIAFAGKTPVEIWLAPTAK